MNQYRIYHTDSLGEDFTTVEALSFDDAAERYINELDMDCKDSIEPSTRAIVRVEDTTTNQMKTFEVNGEIEIYYYVTEIEDK